MENCDKYDPDKVFKIFELIEFPICFVGLTVSKHIRVERDLYTSAYFKTMHEGILMKYEEAREVSASHRAFIITNIDNHTIEITFKPTNECIVGRKQLKNNDNRFVVDLRLIHVDGIRCCNNEWHAEIGRYYISGQFEYIKMSHKPRVLDFGEVPLSKKMTTQLIIRNDSMFTTAKIYYVKSVSFEVSPQVFCIKPATSQNVSITVRPNSLKVDNQIEFHITNPNERIYIPTTHKKPAEFNENIIPYKISCKIKVICAQRYRPPLAESLHMLKHEPDPYYTFNEEELSLIKEHKKKAFEFLTVCKMSALTKDVSENRIIQKDQCYFEVENSPKTPGNKFCKPIRRTLSIYDVFFILPQPTVVDFGRVGLESYAENEITIENNSMSDITLDFFPSQYIFYTVEKERTLHVKLKAMNEMKLILMCFGHLEGSFVGNFEYTINRTFYRQHMYTLQIGNACLVLSDKSLKFGMVTMEAFITSLPIKMHNYFNVTVDFTWNTLNDDMPFEVVPNEGSLPGNSCRLCNVIYNCRPIKAQAFEIDLNLEKRVIPVELYIVTRKLSIQFLETALALNDIALNIETVEKLKLENSSREVAFFYVVEPILPGIKVEPMNGVIGPKMIIPFDVIVKISCVIEFNFDLILKINNKENVVVPVSGNVVEPKINIQPKNVYMSRIPCNMLTYVQVILQNTCNVKSEIEVIDSDDEIFNVYYNKGNEKCRLTKFDIEGGQTKTVFIQVQGTFRREYDFYMPFRVNGLIGPPDGISQSHDLLYYIEKNLELYEKNPKVKTRAINTEISYCRIKGIISSPQLEFSVENFEILYKINGNNSIEFTMKNVSIHTLHITILITKIAPNFILNLTSEENLLMTSENYLKFELITQKAAAFRLKFQPKGPGRFVSVALLYLGTNTTPYYNLTFVGINEMPTIIPSKSRIIYPSTYVGKTVSNIITFTLDIETDLSFFSFASNKQTFVTIELLDYKILENDMTKRYTSITAKISVCSEKPIVASAMVTFRHFSGSSCDIEIKFCFTYCPLTLHVESIVHYEDNPYPYYPEESQIDLYNYLENSIQFLERWMFYQGFRKELYPKIPETLNALAIAMTSQAKEKSKGINVSYLSFIRRIAGPLLKHLHTVLVFDADEAVRQVKDIHGVYGEIIKLLKSRGANIWALEAKFLLSYEQFVTYVTNVPPKNNADKYFIQEILNDVTLFKRLNKQSWIDFILQSYKVFILDSCFFDCVCVSSQPRDILNTLVNWYNDQLRVHYAQCIKGETVKCIKNITTDLCDGIAIIAAFLNHCSFLKDHFSIYSREKECKTDSGKINNACLIIEAINQLRLNFPITSLELLEANFLQMFFLSINLYVVLPMFQPKDVIKFNPPLLKSSTRKVSINPASQESLTLAYFLLDNSKNTFSVEKIVAGDSGQKVAVNVTYNANFVDECNSILLVHGYNKTRIFDTYIVFKLSGKVETFAPLRKCKVSGPNYRPQKVDVFVSSPFTITSTFRMYVLDDEPFIPVKLDANPKRKFYATRLHLIDKDVTLPGMPKETGQEDLEVKIHFILICLNAQISNTWIWFKSNIGEFFIKVTSQPRCDIFLDTLFVKVPEWPISVCSCGEECECYRTTLLMIPHRNDMMIKSLRGALVERASEKMVEIFDQLIKTSTGRVVLAMLLAEGGTNLSEVQHILRNETSFRVTARLLEPRVDRVTLAQHIEDTIDLPITVPVCDKTEKFSVTFTSECGMDIRTYKVVFIENEDT